MYPYRTRFKKEIVAEFFAPPSRPAVSSSNRSRGRRKPKEDKVIIFCPGQPGMPGGKNDRLIFWAKKGFWTFSFRYRGTWESGGKFLRKSPEEDVLDIIDDLTKKQSVEELFAHKRFAIHPTKIFLFGSSFGGPAAILASRDSRVTKVVCFSPVVDFKYHTNHGETNSWAERFTREAFGEAYRFSHKDWKKLDTGKFYNPMMHIKELDGTKLLIIQAKDDKIVPAGPVEKFAKLTNAKLLLLPRGGHVPSEWFTEQKFYSKIVAFLK